MNYSKNYKLLQTKKSSLKTFDKIKIDNISNLFIIL